MQTACILLLLEPLVGCGWTALGTGQCPHRAVCPRRRTSPWILLELLAEDKVCSVPVSGSHRLRRGK